MEAAAEAAAEVGLGRVCGAAAGQLLRSGRQRKRLEVVATATMAVARQDMADGAQAMLHGWRYTVPSTSWKVDADVERSRSTRARLRAAMRRSCQCAHAYCVLPLLNPNLVYRPLPSFSCKCARLRGMGSPSPPVPLPSPSSPLLYPLSLLHLLASRCARPVARSACPLRPCQVSGPQPLSHPPPFLPSSLLLFPPSPLSPRLWLRSYCLACLVARCARSACQLRPCQEQRYIGCGAYFSFRNEKNLK